MKRYMKLRDRAIVLLLGDTGNEGRSETQR